MRMGTRSPLRVVEVMIRFPFWSEFMDGFAQPFRERDPEFQFVFIEATVLAKKSRPCRREPEQGLAALPDAASGEPSFNARRQLDVTHENGSERTPLWSAAQNAMLVDRE